MTVAAWQRRKIVTKNIVNTSTLGIVTAGCTNTNTVEKSKFLVQTSGAGITESYQPIGAIEC